ncbi:hypothetical protein B6N60_03382 [Richelia sinica FACHB-800]|uniref:Uncharacterized protein n=1 Tax=Richelia sinica FACHB-800 TaxID=1357546 RepID=A0A975Y5W9_9NOST|nr:hypothetical protein [Richelia sinica]MBD2663489.1 hypothetical protein [Richelia sinica FACHB-800]QXE24675.1 hypothetical protein B6N60_03382 [Richelia sinica FACHB-800]
MPHIVSSNNLAMVSETVSQSWQNTKNLFQKPSEQMMNSLAELTNQSLSNLTATQEKVNNPWHQTLNHVVTQVTDTTVTAMNSVTSTAKPAETYVRETLGKTQTYLQDTLEQAVNLSNSASQVIEKPINNIINHQVDVITNWINNHPTIFWLIKLLNWAINHPITSLLIVFIGLFIVWKLFQLFSRILEQGLLFTLKTPIKFIYSLFYLSWDILTKKLLNKSVLIQANQSDLQSDNPNSDHNEKLLSLLNRLETIRQEQNHILQEIKTLLTANK